MNYATRISCDPAVLAGKPAIKGTRVPVDLVLKMLSAGMTYEQILTEYLDLEREDILAAISYARSTVNMEEIHHFELVHKPV